jgi:hypothetical protein
MDSPIQSSDKSRQRHLENSREAKQRRHGNGAARFDLLLVPGRRTKADHILLPVPVLPAQVADVSAQGVENPEGDIN